MARRRVISGLGGGAWVVGAFAVLVVLVHWHLTRDTRAGEALAVPEPDRIEVVPPAPPPSRTPTASHPPQTVDLPSTDTGIGALPQPVDSATHDTPPAASLPSGVVHVRSPGEAVDDLTEQVRRHLAPR